jgi:hypothetical protein
VAKLKKSEIVAGLRIKVEDETRERKAVKTFKNITNYSVVLREIECLREMDLCENVISLEGVYRSVDEEGQTVVQLVMRFAKHGSLLKYIVDQQDRMHEDQVRTIMA